MAKPLFQDIVPPDKKNIKKIPIPERSRDGVSSSRAQQSIPVRRPAAAPTRVAPVPTRVAKEPTPEPQPKAPPRPRKVRRSKTPIILTLLALIGIGAGVFFLIPKATGATITITPRGQDVSVNATFTASKDANAALPYQVASYEKDGKLAVPASGDELAQTKASGVIRVYNDYSAIPQKLVANTRFETPKGLIFRINQPVTIPGKVGDTPGSVEVAITADAIGADYNVGYSDFTIPGFKGDPKYEKFYARSKTEITGGFNGNRKKVDQAQVTAARQKIREELEASLIRQMQQNIPEDFAFPKGAYFIEYQSLPDNSIDNGVEIRERATFHGIMFKRADLAHAIASKVNGVQPNEMTQDDLGVVETLAFTAKPASNATSTTVWNSQTFSFTLNGTTTLISAIDTDRLEDELLGKPRKSLNAILAGYPGIANAEVVMRPFWQQSFPVDKAEITINVAKSPNSQ
jgi:hypothetical protein